MSQPSVTAIMGGNLLIGIGGNVTSDTGTPREIQKMARFALEMALNADVFASRSFRTPCFPAGAGPEYVNAAWAAKTNLPPSDVLVLLHEIESRFGRIRQERWGMRTLDLDLLAYDDLITPDLEGYQAWRGLPVETQKMRAPDQLILPHPRLQDRGFVLIPVMDVAPDWTHPVSGRTIRQMVEALPQDERDEVVPLE